MILSCLRRYRCRMQCYVQVLMVVAQCEGREALSSRWGFGRLVIFVPFRSDFSPTRRCTKP